MSKRLGFDIVGKAYSVLSDRPGERLKARDIAKLILQKFPDECAEKKDNASVDFTDYSFEDQLVSEIGSRWRRLVERFDNVETIETRPREFLVTLENESESAEAVRIDVKRPERLVQTISEHDLYPLLGKYVASEISCMAMRIDERRSKNTRGPRGNHWLYPDVVGFQDLSQNWSHDMRTLAKSAKAETAHLYSFEVKLLINRSNVREVFFQTLSNSAWAHYAYLCASEINSRAMDELSMLCGSHGIGVIRIDVEDVSNSQILIPAALKAGIDWNLLNRLADENSDAKHFVKCVRDFYLTGETSPRLWDLFPEESD